MPSNVSKDFRQHLSVQNAFIMRLNAVLTLILFPGFWILDWFVIPDYIQASLIMRVVGTAYGGFLLWASYRRLRWVRKYHVPLGMALGVSLCWAISVMCWLDSGLESSYYAGINLVVIVMGMTFSWTSTHTILFSLLVYGFYNGPALLGLVKVHDFPIMISNQFFLLSTLILAGISQMRRVEMELRQFNQRKMLKTYLSQMRVLATKDGLTHLNNRRYVMSLAEKDHARCERYKRPLTVFLLDIDWFKKINDAHTHRVGDEVLEKIAARIASAVRSIDVVGRYGGEEFLVVLPESGVESSHLVAERIRKAVRDTPIPTSAGDLKVTLSLGMAGKSTETIPLQTLIDRADLALYQAKAKGRDCIVEWKQEMGRRRVA